MAVEDDANRILTLLEKVGYDATPEQFKATLDKYRDHPEAVKALAKGVEKRGKHEDSGSYCEAASPGYQAYWEKNRALEILKEEEDRDFLANADPSVLEMQRTRHNQSLRDLVNFSNGRPTPPPEMNSADTIQQLRDQVRELTERVSLLEKRAIRGPKIAGP